MVFMSCHRATPN